MRSVLNVCLGIFFFVVVVVVVYEQGRRSMTVAPSSSNATLCQDALARRRQADQALVTPPSGDYAVTMWQRSLPTIRAQRDAADTDQKRYC